MDFAELRCPFCLSRDSNTLSFRPDLLKFYCLHCKGNFDATTVEKLLQRTAKILSMLIAIEGQFKMACVFLTNATEVNHEG